MDIPKIVIIGAGSAFTYGLVNDLLFCSELEPIRLSLYDIDSEILADVTKGVREKINYHRKEIKVEAALELKSALHGADFIILTISVGGITTHELDIKVPLEFGIPQTTGDTIGPGGIFRTLRSIPVVLKICRVIEEVSPQAWLLNLTNPMAQICRAVNKFTSVKILGFCHCITGFLHRVASTFNLPEEEIKFQSGGINHLGWIRELKYKNRDLLQELKKKFSEGLTHPFTPVQKLLFNYYGLLPYPNGRHLAEFFKSFFNFSNYQTNPYELRLRNIEEQRQKHEETRLFWREEALKEEKLRQITPSDEKLIPTIVSLLGKGNTCQVLNISNQGSVSNLPSEAVVEIPASVSEGKVEGIKSPPVPLGLRSLLTRVITEQEIMIEAAVKGEKDLVLQAFLLDSQLEGEEIGKIEALVKKMFETQRDYLPQFKI
jgi:alpha-galactosidase